MTLKVSIAARSSQEMYGHGASFHRPSKAFSL